MILVTHDIDEAIAMSDRVVLLGGRPAKIVMEQKIDLTTQGPRTAVSARELRNFMIITRRSGMD
ncbi:aliphatic sulfonates transport ATP-binding subunit [Tatumella ptyseos]|uniref:Aliphatic sulfonates transport ATP-binding subunit n=1 Tax=Tatumella ptyseos TaxID=82987 RepID=A0A2X5PG88_9GAMM|nr:aliphatic sulfonates transport ATP-binding subunit [Tatumella ptyseos]